MTEHEAWTRLYRWHGRAWRWCLLGGVCLAIPLGMVAQGDGIAAAVVCMLVARFVLGVRMQSSREAVIESRAVIERLLGPRVALDAVRKQREES